MLLEGLCTIQGVSIIRKILWALVLTVAGALTVSPRRGEMILVVFEPTGFCERVSEI